MTSSWADENDWIEADDHRSVQRELDRLREENERLRAETMRAKSHPGRSRNAALLDGIRNTANHAELAEALGRAGISYMPPDAEYEGQRRDDDGTVHTRSWHG